jgi:hypothetical protein
LTASTSRGANLGHCPSGALDTSTYRSCIGEGGLR